jgi:hypothetical protein
MQASPSLCLLFHHHHVIESISQDGFESSLTIAAYQQDRQQ